MNQAPLIWIIDDDDLFILITRNNIRKASSLVETEVFHDGLESMNSLKERIASGGILPDIILLDLNMPVVDGWNFLENYIEIDENVREKINLYLCTSSIDPKDINRAKEIKEVKDFKEKPLTTEAINDILAI